MRARDIQLFTSSYPCITCKYKAGKESMNPNKCTCWTLIFPCLILNPLTPQSGLLTDSRMLIPTHRHLTTLSAERG